MTIKIFGYGRQVGRCHKCGAVIMVSFLTTYGFAIIEREIDFDHGDEYSLDDLSNPELHE